MNKKKRFYALTSKDLSSGCAYVCSDGDTFAVAATTTVAEGFFAKVPPPPPPSSDVIVDKNLYEFCLRYCGEYELNEPNNGESSVVSSVSSPAAPPVKSWL